MSEISYIPSTPKIIWKNLLFFIITTVIALIGTPWYIKTQGAVWTDWALMLFFIYATGMSITVGYHRLFAHRTFSASPIIEFLILFFGAAAFEQSAYKWASQHRDHHLYVDTEKDPYSIKKGFWYAHIEWLVFWKHHFNFGNSKDLQQNKMLMNQHKYYGLWAVGAGIVFPLILGWMMGNVWGALILNVCLRLTLVYHSTFCINSVCHMFGKPTFDIYSTAKDHWFVALLTFGEGYHNFHHRFPSDYRNGVRWYHWDPSKWFIFAIEKLGLAHDLKRVSKFKVLDARLAAQNQLAKDMIVKKVKGQRVEELKDRLDNTYREVRHKLLEWEQAAKSYRELLGQRFSTKSSNIRTSAFIKLETAKKHFKDSKKNWKALQQKQFGLAV